MKKYHQNLASFLKEKKASVKFVFELGIQLLNSLECLHSSGYIYNDLKHSNIMIDLDNKNELDVTLIDFSHTTKYLDMKDNHISNGHRLQQFQGSIIHASVDKMNLMRTSRKDDIISLCYLMILILNENDLPCQNGALKQLCNGDSELPINL